MTLSTLLSVNKSNLAAAIPAAAAMEYPIMPAPTVVSLICYEDRGCEFFQSEAYQRWASFYTETATNTYFDEVVIAKLDEFWELGILELVSLPRDSNSGVLELCFVHSDYDSPGTHPELEFLMEVSQEMGIDEKSVMLTIEKTFEEGGCLDSVHLILGDYVGGNSLVFGSTELGVGIEMRSVNSTDKAVELNPVQLTDVLSQVETQ